jgi:hypothetical protein
LAYANAFEGEKRRSSLRSKGGLEEKWLQTIKEEMR